MINILIDKPNFYVKVSGHANSAEAGHDIVCASVSALVHTLQKECASLFERRFGDFDSRIESGYAEFRFYPKDYSKNEASEGFFSICRGFEELAERCPEYVKIVNK